MVSNPDRINPVGVCLFYYICKKKKVMANIDDYLVASYRCNGKGNSDADKDMLKDLSGNGYDIKLHGFSFDKWSGYGEDTIAFDSNNVCHKDMVEFTSTKISCQGDVEFDDKWILKLNGMPPSYRIKVSGVSNIGNGAIIVNVGRKKEASGVMSYLISNDGIYTPGDSDKDVDDQGIYIEGGNYNIKGPFSIELLPSFKDALVFDGIDDYGICENFPAINDFTFVYKRINLNPSKSTNCFLSKSVSTNQAQQFCSELAYSKNVYVRLGSKDIAVKDIYNPELSIVYVTRESYNGEMDLVSSNYTSTVDNLYIGTFSRGVQAYVWNGALYALDIYDRTLSDEYLQKALNRMNDIDINWKDGVGEVTDQHLTVSPGSGTGNAAVSFGSVMNKGLDRTLELEITTPKGVKKTLTVNQEGCRQAYITSDGKRWLTSDNRVYGVLKSDAPCQCNGTCLISYVRPDGSITDAPSDNCIGVVLNAQGKRFMIEKYEDLNESYVTAGAGKDSTSIFYWGGYGTDQTGITNYDKVDGSDIRGYLKPESGSYNGTPNLSANITAWTSGALSDWNGKSNSEILKGITTGGGSYTSYATIGHVLNTFLASADAKGYDDWYIPSCAQLALIFMNLTSVNNALSAIGGQQLSPSKAYWVSSEFDSNSGHRVYFKDGSVNGSSKGSRYSVRFIRDI